MVGYASEGVGSAGRYLVGVALAQLSRRTGLTWSGGVHFTVVVAWGTH